MEQQTKEQVTNNITSDLKPTSGYKKWLWLILVLFLAGAIYGLIQWTRKQPVPASKEEVAIEQSKEFEDRLSELPADATKEDKYKLYLRVARAEYQLKNYDTALEWLGKFPEEDKNYQGVWYTYSQIYKDQGDKAKALESIKKAVIATPDNPQPWQLYFELITNLPRSEQGAIYKEALTKTENDPDIVAAYDQWKNSQ